MNHDERMRAEGAMNALEIAGERIKMLESTLAEKCAEIERLREKIKRLEAHSEQGIIAPSYAGHCLECEDSLRSSTAIGYCDDCFTDWEVRIAARAQEPAWPEEKKS